MGGNWLGVCLFLVVFCSGQSTEAIVPARSHLRYVSNPMQLDTTDSSSKDSFPPTMNKILDDI